MPMSSNAYFSQQTLSIGETSGKHPQWGSLDSYPHCPVATSLSGQSQLYQGSYAAGEELAAGKGCSQAAVCPPWQHSHGKDN